MTSIISHPDLDSPPASLLVRGVLYAWRKSFGIRFDPRLRDKVLDLFKRVEPMRVTGIPKVRVGTARDGSYVMLDDFDKIAGAYSIGIGGDVSWDLSLAERGIPIFQFDHTIPGSPAFHPLFHFERTGVGVKADPTARLATLENLLRRHPDKTEQLILKMDVEGAEWSILDQMSDAVLPRFRQIICEFHNFHEIDREPWYERAHRVFSRLNETHQAIHLHRNNWGPRIWVGDVEIPMLVEITFASRSSYTFEATDEPFPGPYDRPSTRLFPDRPLTFLREL